MPGSRALVVTRLRRAGCVAAEEEAELFCSAAPDDATLEEWLRRREQGHPVAWITGVAQFCGHPVVVVPGVFVPRQQTEELARRAARVLPSDGWAIDLCTGSGAIAAHLRGARPEATVMGVDDDPAAAGCARRNGVAVIVGDLGAAVRPATFDVVTAVPPYVPTDQLRLLPPDVLRHEPRHTLDGGADGLAVATNVVAAASRLLRPGGWLLMEAGGEQDVQLEPLLAAGRFGAIESWSDGDGDLRGVAGRFAG